MSFLGTFLSLSHSLILVDLGEKIPRYQCQSQGRIHIWSESALAPPPFWQINHANSAYFRLFLGYFRVISATRPPFWISASPFYISWIRPCNLLQKLSAGSPPVGGKNLQCCLKANIRYSSMRILWKFLLTSRGSNMPFLVTMICLGCSSTGRDRIKAATSSAVFHLANWKYQVK